METSQDAYIHNLRLFLNGVPGFYNLKYPERLDLPPASVHVSALKCMESGSMKNLLMRAAQNRSVLRREQASNRWGYSGLCLAKQGFQVA